MASDPDPETHPARARSIPPFVWLASVTMLTVLLLGTLVLPLLRVPDEKHHADMALMAQEGIWLEAGWPGLGERSLNRSIVAASLSLGPREAALRENRAAQHPPLFYLAAALTSSVITFPVDYLDLPLRIWSFRLVSVLMSAALPLTFYLIAAELTTSRWIRLTSAVMPLVIPGITLRNGAMVNNDALLLVLTSLSVLYAVRVTKGDLTSRNSISLGLSTGLAALTKAHGLVVIPVIVIAYLTHIVRARRPVRDWLQSAVLSSGITLALGGWWWIRNLMLYGAIQPLRELEPAGPLDLDWMEWLTSATGRMVGSFWGGNFALGGRGYMPLFWILTISLVIACVVGWVRSRDRVTTSVSAMYALLLVVAVFLTSARLYAERGMVSAVQGRYFFPGLPGIAPLIVLAAAGIGRRVVRWLPALFVTGSAVMTFLAVRYMLSQYWGPFFGPEWADQWSGVVTISPFPEVISTGILVLATVGLLSLLASAVSMGLRGESVSRAVISDESTRDSCLTNERERSA